MYQRSFRLAPSLLAFLLLGGALLQTARADPPGRVAYLSDSRGEISYSPAGEDAWLGFERNRPLIRGDRLWSDRDARAELQIGSAALRLSANTGLEILDIADQSTQLQLTEGSLNLRIRRLQRGETFEIDTPMLAFVIEREGRYRIDVDDYESTTRIVVWEGAGEAYGENGSFPLQSGDAVTFYDNDLGDYQLSALPARDSFDRYCRERDGRLDRSRSLQYVGDDLAGYSQLDDYGRWRRVSAYGDVWFPSQVSSGWAPYRDGHWVWQEPWGWTWIDNAPWGFAPSHYGRWVSISDRWGWIPGPRRSRPIYAPALVAFIGGRNWSLSVSLGSNDAPIGWFALGPREVYVPSYQASREYFTRVNVNNTVINNTVINNYYGSYSRGESQITQNQYVNRSVANAITAVPQSVFVNAQPVRAARIELDRVARSSGQLTRLAPVAPALVSVLGAAERAAKPPPRGNFDRPVLARTPPPQREAPFAQRERQLQQTPGQAVDSRAASGDSGQSAARARRIQLINERQAATNLRETESRRAAEAKPVKPADRTAPPARTDPRNQSERNQNERNQNQRDQNQRDQNQRDQNQRDQNQRDQNQRNDGSGDRRPPIAPPARNEPKPAPDPRPEAVDPRRSQPAPQSSQAEARARAAAAAQAEQQARDQQESRRQNAAQAERDAAREAQRSRGDDPTRGDPRQPPQRPPPTQRQSAPPAADAPPARGNADDRGRGAETSPARQPPRGNADADADDEDDDKDKDKDKDGKNKDKDKRDR